MALLPGLSPSAVAIEDRREITLCLHNLGDSKFILLKTVRTFKHSKANDVSVRKICHKFQTKHCAVDGGNTKISPKNITSIALFAFIKNAYLKKNAKIASQLGGLGALSPIIAGTLCPPFLTTPGACVVVLFSGERASGFDDSGLMQTHQHTLQYGNLRSRFQAKIWSILVAPL